ncbi:MAG: isoleucine--tRNA ligase [Candidatus Hydrothermarchaeales archaeon]
MIKKAERRLNLVDLEERIQDFWSNEKIYEKSKAQLADKPKYYFLDGPPYASGAIHLGTAWNKILKDSITRYLAAKGLNVRRQPGWDCHGLPIEVKVEEKLGIKNKKEIEELGIEKFVQECKNWATEHIVVMTAQFKRLGVWMDWDKPYTTMRDEYIEAAWWTMKRAYEKGLITRDLRVVTWCPRCETALAEAEIEYKDREDPSIYVKFPIVDKEGEYIFIWTTTPWTLIGNLAVMVHPEFEYVRAKTKEGVLILAKELAPLLKEKFGLDYKILSTHKGSELEGMRYTNPLNALAKPPEKAYFVILTADFVTLEEGTGCVHCAPGHGPEDFEVGAEYGIAPICPVDERGAFTEDAGRYAGKIVKRHDNLITQDLKERGALLGSETLVHRYGHCWRCKTPIIYRATKQWFIQITKLKDKMLEEIEKVEWIPEWAGSARFKDWVMNARDWTISRQRYWGIPIPIWICEKCGSIEVIDSKKELEERADITVKELHKPFVDGVVLPCECGGSKIRVPDVLDVWFDSGVATWASLGYPSTKPEFEKWYPVDFITEGHDQTRGWFYSMLGCGLLALDEVPYRRVLMHGFTLDEKGEKMSKSLGNVVQPEEVIDKYGVEVLRFYVLWANKPWEDLRFNWDEVRVVYKMFNVLWNVYVFATTYMGIDDFDPNNLGRERYRVEDRWILSRLNSLTKEVTSSFEAMHVYKATRAIKEFVLEDLSRWYITLIRPRTWIEKNDPEKLAAYAALYKVLTKLCVVMAPIAPHITEEIYGNLDGRMESVHLEAWSDFDAKVIDRKLEGMMEIARRFSDAVSSARGKKGIKRRWPISRIVYRPSTEEAKEAIEGLLDLVKMQCNALEVKILEPEEELSEALVSEEFEFGMVFLDLTRTPDVLSLGYARELVRRIQEMRKELDLDVEADIKASIQIEDSKIAELLEAKKGYICGETRAKSLEISQQIEREGYTKEWPIEKDTFVISLKEINGKA